MAMAGAGATSECGGYALRIADETGATEARPTAPGFDDITDPSFREFVKVVSEHVFTTACGGAMPPPRTDAADADVQLLFIRRPLVKQVGAVVDDLLASVTPAASDLRRLVSPWARFEISREPRCRIRAVFIWNERQFLRDQAAMEAGRAVGNGPPVSIDREALVGYSQEYANSVVLAPPEARKAALAELATRIPPEILWLYRHAFQSTLDDFSVIAMEALDATILKAGQGYANVATALFDRCFKSAAGNNEHFKTILDLKGVANLDAYRIEALL